MPSGCYVLLGKISWKRDVLDWRGGSNRSVFGQPFVQKTRVVNELQFPHPAIPSPNVVHLSGSGFQMFSGSWFRLCHPVTF